MPRIVWDIAQIRKWYWDEHKSSVKISVLIGCSNASVVVNAMKRLGIPRRSLSEANKVANRKGSVSSAWRGGFRQQTKKGYIKVYLSPDDPLASMLASVKGRRTYVQEHRLVMARHIGRPLLKTEYVHHINGIKDDNRIENLRLVSPFEHTVYNAICSQCSLRKELRLLRWQIKELQESIQGRLTVL